MAANNDEPKIPCLDGVEQAALFEEAIQLKMVDGLQIGIWSSTGKP
uniref:Uncharacterized protein n=1 Tax=Talaromyces marneffei PM1 TaxID=1077442 RepID=A0A093X8J3_TALMA